MKVIRTSNRELLNLSLVVLITLVFLLYSLSINFIDIVHEYLPYYQTLPVGDLGIKLTFLWLLVTLALTYQRWRVAVERKKELEDIISSINTDVLVVVDKNGAITMCNASLQGMFGFDADEVLNQKIGLLYADSYSSESRKQEIMEKLLRDGFYVEQATGKKKNGDIIPLEVVTYNRKNHTGAVLLLRDITERKKTEEKLERYRQQLETLVNRRTGELTTSNEQLLQESWERKHAEESLRESEERLRSLVQSASDAILTINARGEIKSWNTAAVTIFGYAPEEIIGNSFSVLVPERCRQNNMKSMGKLFSTDSASFVGKTFEFPGIRKDGREFPAEVSYASYETNDGMLFTGIVRDIGERRKAEQALKEARAFLENIIKTTADGIIIATPDGVITMVNETAEKITGYSKDELIGRRSTDLISQEECYKEKGQHYQEKLRDSGVITGAELVWQRKGGVLLDVEMNIALLKDAAGTVTGSVGTIRDITERKKAEEDLKKTKEFLEKVIENTKDGILIVNETGHIASSNSAMEKMSGFCKEEMVGKHASTLVVNDKEMRKIILEKTVELFEKGFTTYEAQYKAKDGKCIDIECTSSMISNDQGEYSSGVSVIRDITERKKAEHKTREAKEFLENLFKTSADGIIITDDQGTITMVNAATEKMLGYPRNDLIGKSTSVLNPEGKQYQDHVNNYLAELFEKGFVTAFEFTWLKKDGGLVDVEVNAALLKDSKNNITGAMTSIRDITDRKHHQEALKKAYDEMEIRVKERTADLKCSNEQLKREIRERELAEKKLFEAKEFAEYANKAKSEFLANMSHEFRTPLNHIIGFTELVVDKNFGDLNGTQEEYLNDVLHSSKHLLSLINDILDLSKVEAGKMRLEPSPVDLPFLLEHSLIMFKEKTFKHGIELSADVIHIPETITADERKLKQILYNLLSNAVKFTPDGGNVCLKARVVDCMVRHGKRWGDPKGLQIIAQQSGTRNAENAGCGSCIEFSVTDTGIGIKPEDLERIFKPFEQADGSTSRKYQGTGLGLSLTKRLVELHGGKIWVESEGEGKGSTFRFTIPAELC